MKTMIYETKKSHTIVTLSIFLFSLLLFTTACHKDHNENAVKNFNMVNLVASSNQYAGARVDANLVNGWGIAFSPTGNAWLSAEGTGSTVVYSSTGAEVLPAVTIPTVSSLTGGHPTGVIYNGTTDFTLTGGNPAKFIFAGADGEITAWNAGGAAVRVLDNSSNSAYTGIAMATDAGANFIYLANFKAARIDVYDKNFASVSKTFTDPNLPDGYAPFNIQNIDGSLYVTYAKVDPATGEEMKGAGFGYVDIYTPGGTLVKRFASQSALNAPWGVAHAPAGFFNDRNGDAILIGNFGDGRILAFNTDGSFIGALRNNSGEISIDGLWGLSFAPSTSGIDGDRLFFAAGPNDEQAGVFGYIEKQ